MSVIAYIDGSQFTDSVCLHAAWAARQLDTSVTLVHILEYAASNQPLLEDGFGMGGLDDDERRITLGVEEPRLDLASLDHEARQEILTDAARNVRDRGVERVRTAIDYGTIEDHIREHSAEADLIVVGKRGEHSAALRGRLGDHLEHVIRGSRRPILVAPSEPSEIKTFLIAFDGGHQSGNAIRFLIEQPLLKECEGTLILAGDRVELQQQLFDAASHLRSAGYAVQAELGHGAPDRLIPDILNAEEIDLLVMGSFAHPRLHAMLGLSTTRKLLRSSRKAILVVP